MNAPRSGCPINLTLEALRRRRPGGRSSHVSQGALGRHRRGRLLHDRRVDVARVTELLRACRVTIESAETWNRTGVLFTLAKNEHPT